MAPSSSVNLSNIFLEISGKSRFETWDPLSRFTRKTMCFEAYGFPLKPFLSALCYLWPSPHGARTRDGAPADRSDFFLNIQSISKPVRSENGHLEAASYGQRAAAAAAAAAAAKPPRGSGTKNSKNDLFRNFKGGTPQVWRRVRA